MEQSEERESTQPQIAGATIDEGRLFQYREELRLEQNLPMALAGGMVAAMAGAFLWAFVTVTTNFQIGYMAVGVGFMVGYTVRYLGRGLDQVFGVVGGVFAFLGCILGNFFSIVGYAANEEGIGFFDLLFAIDYSVVPAIMSETFSFIDLLFYGIAIYEGYKFSFRQITEEELMRQASRL